MKEPLVPLIDNASDPAWLLLQFGGRESLMLEFAKYGISLYKPHIDSWFRAENVPEKWQLRAYVIKSGALKTGVEWLERSKGKGLL